MPALGGGFAMLKWISSFPGNPAAHGLPTVMGVVCLSDAATSAPLMLLDARAVTALRTGAVAAVAASALAPAGARTVGIVGCGLHGAWAARCLAAAGYGPGVCFDPRAPVAERAGGGARLGGRRPRRRARLRRRVLRDARLRAGHRPRGPAAGLHLNMLGADGPGKAEATVEAVAACELFCDEWAQAVARRRADGAVEAGAIARDARHRARRGARRRRARSHATPTPSTLFDSTGLAIQDLAIAVAAHDVWRARRGARASTSASRPAGR